MEDIRYPQQFWTICLSEEEADQDDR